MTTIILDSNQPTETPAASAPADGSDELEVIDDLDHIASTKVMLGCGNDNPF